MTERREQTELRGIECAMDDEALAIRTPGLATRFALSTAVGIAAASVAAAIANMLRPLGKTGSDFDQLWIAGRALLGGADPYAAAEAYWPWGLGYPLPTVLLSLPFAPLPLDLARPLFTGLTAAAFVFAATARGWWTLPMVVSGAFLAATMVSQWSPLLLAGVFIPGLSFFWFAKPTLAVALWAAWPHRTAVIGAVVALAVSLALAPTWPREWWETVGADPHLLPAIARPFGWLMLLSLLKWRRPEARFLAVLACVPHTEAWPDALLLFAVVTSFREATLLALTTLGGLALGWRLVGAPTWPGDLARFLDALWPFVLGGAYLPALVLVLRRPNTGALPSWLTRRWLPPPPEARRG
jgi:hypothetical protein